MEPDPAAQLRDIAPPVDVFPYPLWMVIAAALVAAAVLGFVAWLIIRSMRKRRALPPVLPHQLALQQLAAARARIDTAAPYEFSIEVSDILRRYVATRYALPATRQTSPEFLAAAAESPLFSLETRERLTRFLEKADLIKFARLEATTEDSERLCGLAEEVVKGGNP